MKSLWRIYASLCGLVLGPALLAVVLANVMGVLSVDRIQAAYAALELPRHTETRVAAENVVQGEDSAKTAPDDLHLWEERLVAMGQGIVSDVEDLGREVERLNVLEAQLDSVQEALAPVVSAVLEEEIDRAAVVVRSSELVERLRRLRSEEGLMPKLLATLSTVDPKSLALIVSGGEDGGGLDEEQTVALLSEFKPRKAGEVLAEVGKLDPTLAARLVSRLGGKEPR